MNKPVSSHESYQEVRQWFLIIIVGIFSLSLLGIYFWIAPGEFRDKLINFFLSVIPSASVVLWAVILLYMFFHRFGISTKIGPIDKETYARESTHDTQNGRASLTAPFDTVGLEIHKMLEGIYGKCMDCRSFCAHVHPSRPIGDSKRPEYLEIVGRAAVLRKAQEMLNNASDTDEVLFMTNGLNVTDEVMHFFMSHLEQKNFRIIHNHPPENKWRNQFKLITEESDKVVQHSTDGIRLLLIDSK